NGRARNDPRPHRSAARQRRHLSRIARSMTGRRRVGVLISGRGSNLGALVETTKATNFPAEIVLVISNKAEAAGLRLAADQGIPTQVIAARDFSDRAAHDRALNEALHAAGAE